MFWSKNNTFRKRSEEIDSLFKNMQELLTIKNRSLEDIWLYKKAFLYFRSNPYKFDGATIVKDLNDLPNLDLDAMVHDWQYLTGANKSFVKKYKADLYYIRNMEKNGKGIRIVRFLLLTLIGIIFVPYCKIFK